MKKTFHFLPAILLACILLLTACGSKPAEEQTDAPVSAPVTEESADETGTGEAAPDKTEPADEAEAAPQGPTAEELEAARRSAMPVPEPTDYVFDEENVVVTFAALADTHLRVAGTKNSYTNDNMASAVEFLMKRTDNGLDAIFMAGDVTDSGLSGQVQSFADIVAGLEIPVLFATGNHDIMNSAMTSYMEKALYKNAYASDIDTESNAPGCRHSVVGGIHFIQVSASGYNKGQQNYADETVAWLRRRLEIAAADAPGMPIFVSTHLPISNSVFGSNAVSAAHPMLVWASEELKSLLNEYPQTVLLSGHTHYPHAAENSIAQDGFTMVNIGTLKHMVIDYWFENSTDSLTGSRNHPGGMLVEVDANGGVRMTRYDFGLGLQVGDAWILPPTGHEDFLQVYTYGRANAPGPQFPAKDFAVEAVPAGSDTTRTLRLTFSSADSTAARVYYYQADIEAANSSEVKTLKYVTDFAFAPQPEDMQAAWTLDVENISIGTTYTITLTPYNVWNVPGESQTVTIDLT